MNLLRRTSDLGDPTYASGAPQFWQNLPEPPSCPHFLHFFDAGGTSEAPQFWQNFTPGVVG